MENVLLLGAGTQALSIVKGLAKAGHKVFLYYEHSNYADKSRYVTKRIRCQVPMMSDKYLANVEDIILREHIDVIIPMGDTAAEFVSKNKERLRKIVHLSAPNYTHFVKGYDKNQLMNLCKENGYPHPQSIDLSGVKDLNCDELINFHFPAMLKPNCTTGGRGMVVVNSHEDFVAKYQVLHRLYGDYHLQKFIREGGRQVKIQLCVDADGRMIGHSAMQKVRWFPVKAGSSCCSVSINEENATAMCLQILRDLQWEGFADFDLIEDPDTHELLVMEINPRLPACLGAATHAGADWGCIIVDHAMGRQIGSYEYKTGVVLRHLGFDVLWFLKSPKRFGAKPSWFRFFGKNVFYQDMDGWGNMKPFFSGTYNNFKKLFDPSFKKTKGI